MLRQALRKLAGELGLSSEILLTRANIAPTARAEEIGLDDFIALTEVVREAAGSGQ
jgi:hypothetical protein